MNVTMVVGRLIIPLSSIERLQSLRPTYLTGLGSFLEHSFFVARLLSLPSSFREAYYIVSRVRDSLLLATPQHFPLPTYTRCRCRCRYCSCAGMNWNRNQGINVPENEQKKAYSTRSFLSFLCSSSLLHFSLCAASHAFHFSFLLKQNTYMPWTYMVPSPSPLHFLFP